MKFTCYSCVANLIVLGIAALIFALWGVDVIKIITFGSELAYRVFLAVGGVSALFTIYSLIVFKPFKGLK